MRFGFGWTILFPAIIFLVALALIASHIRAWRIVESGRADPIEREHRRRQFRRRMQASTLLAVVALGLSAGQIIPSDRFPSLFVFYWSLVALSMLWLTAIAMTDVVATVFHVGRIRRRQESQRTRLEAELSRHRDKRMEEEG